MADSKEFSFLLRTHRSLSVFAKEFPKCHFGRLVHLTAHAEHISTKSEKTRVPIYEGKFIEQYDNRFSTFAGMSADERYQAKASARRQPGDSFVAPKLAPECRYFIDKKFWESFLDRYDQPYSLCWRSLNGCHRLIHEKTGFTAWDRYYWNLVPNSRNLFDKVAAIKDEHLWDEVIDEYLEKKNMYLRRQDYNHPSFNVYVETVNQVFNKYFD